jgi:hypothetical protein
VQNLVVNTMQMPQARYGDPEDAMTTETPHDPFVSAHRTGDELHAPPPPPPRQAGDRQWQPPGSATPAATKTPVPTILQAAAAMGMIVALVLSTDGQESFYSATPAWAVFATIAAIVQFAPSLAKQTGWSPERSWTIGAAGVGGLFAWWVLIALPGVSSNQGFAATLAVAAAVAGSWLAPGRRL